MPTWKDNLRIYLMQIEIRYKCQQSWDFNQMNFNQKCYGNSFKYFPHKIDKTWAASKKFNFSGNKLETKTQVFFTKISPKIKILAHLIFWENKHNDYLASSSRPSLGSKPESSNSTASSQRDRTNSEHGNSTCFPKTKRLLWLVNKDSEEHSTFLSTYSHMKCPKFPIKNHLN